MKRVLILLACGTFLLCSSIDEEIEAIQKAPVEERYKLMNALKKKIAHMKELKRLQSIKRIQLATKGKIIKYEHNRTSSEQNVTKIPFKNIENQNEGILDNQIDINIEEPEYEHEDH